MPFNQPAFWSVAILVLAGLALIIGLLLRQNRLQRRELLQMETRLETASQKVQASELKLETMQVLNRDLIRFEDEQHLVQSALEAIKRLSGGIGCTYQPLDLWGLPQPAFTFGDLPEPVLRGWSDHLLSERVRSRCAQCQILHAEPTQECPLHLNPVGLAMAIYCLPLALGERRLGMVNLYMKPDHELSAETRQFVEGMLDQMALGIEALRLRTSEMNTLRELQRLRSPRADLTLGLETLLDGLCGSLGMDGIQIRLRPMTDERLSNLAVQAGLIPVELPAEIEEDLRKTLEIATSWAGQSQDGIAWRTLPVQLPEGQVLGTLLAVRRSSQNIPSRYQEMLQTAAAQAALMIDYERSILSLEYRLVIQERTRLAREIHDGLAQTLAFLKMQTAQMQTALGQGDQIRLVRLLQESKNALAEAYNDTRQAIDNLRVNPEAGLGTWIEKASREFEKATGVHVELALAQEELGLLPEVQAQMVRILQEALNNVRKHAQASTVRLSLRAWGDDCILEVIDDGLGFDPEDVPPAAQFGLRGMRERAELIGAEFQIVSQPKQGTTVRLFLPGQLQEVDE
jgi:two-component system, NarL family, nitrate/nitrite sensor histidine kinase NarX